MRLISCSVTAIYSVFIFPSFSLLLLPLAPFLVLTCLEYWIFFLQISCCPNCVVLHQVAVSRTIRYRYLFFSQRAVSWSCVRLFT